MPWTELLKPGTKNSRGKKMKMAGDTALLHGQHNSTFSTRCEMMIECTVSTCRVSPTCRMYVIYPLQWLHAVSSCLQSYWTVDQKKPSSTGHCKIDVCMQSCARLLVCVCLCECVCLCVCVCVCFSLCLSCFLSLYLSLSLSLYPCLFLSFRFSLSLVLSLVLSLCISVYLCLCVCTSVRLCVFVLIDDVIHQIVFPNLRKRPLVHHQQHLTRRAIHGNLENPN